MDIDPSQLNMPGFSGGNQPDLEIELHANIGDKDLWASKFKSPDGSDRMRSLTNVNMNNYAFGVHVWINILMQASFLKHEPHKIQISLPPPRWDPAVMCED